jgi:uncharacterized membrane protein
MEDLLSVGAVALCALAALLLHEKNSTARGSLLVATKTVVTIGSGSFNLSFDRDAQ